MRWFLPFLGLLTLTTAAHAVECGELSALQVAAGYVTWMHTLEFFAIVIGAGSLVLLLGHWITTLLALFTLIPVGAYEVIGHLVSLFVITSGVWFSRAHQDWAVFGGSLLWGGMLTISLSYHSKSSNFTGYFALLTGLWAAVAVVFHNEATGSLAVLAFMGFVLSLFEDHRHVVGQIATASGVVAVLAAIFQATGFYNVFLPGSLWVGPGVLAISLLFLSSRWHRSEIPFVFRQILPAIFAVVGLWLGSVYNVPHLAGIASTFLMLFIISKLIEIPAKGVVGYATVGLITSLVVGSAVWWAQGHMDTIQPYLLF
jgi:hypothetical protein